MIPNVSAAVSLFGAPLDTSQTVASTSNGSLGFAGSFVSELAGTSLHATTGGTASAQRIDAVPGIAATPFGDLAIDAVGQVEELERQSKAAIEGLISGNGVDVHEAMIAAQKASMGFELVLAMRNKALAAYQQVLGMQF
jgi:flagellar hook-basal body complex protein FliE